VESGPDTATTVLSILALVLSLGALACAYLVFKATELPV
jgi:hypothetical protein